MRTHLYADTVNGTPRELGLELGGDRVHYAGGNAALDVLSGPAAGSQSPTPTPQLQSSVPGTSSAAGAIVNTSGGTSSVPRVQASVATLFVLAALALVVLHRGGFKFSATVG